ncbi:MAG: WYL domain-containing protein [Deltaproteobacteria bacterium]|nr:WYL domain-containing protein [Deltaproteobacteria bacterium]
MVRRSSPGRPAGKYTQAVRLFQLYHRLENSPEGVRIDDIARELDVTPRSVRRDLKALQNAEIEVESIDNDGERRVRLARTGKTTEPIRMTRFQRYSLTAVRRAFDVLEGTPFHDDLSQLFAKLTQGNSGEPNVQNEGLSERFVYIPDAPKNYRKFKDQLYEIYDGVLRSLTLSFMYDGGSTMGMRRMEPYCLVLYRNGLYVVGKDVTKKEMRTFAVERMRRVRALPQAPFVRDVNFDVKKLFDGAFGLISNNKAIEHVMVEFTARVSTYIEERQWHPSQKLTRLVDGGVTAELDVSLGPELWGWILRWGADAKVISPPALIETIRAEQLRAAEQYSVTRSTIEPVINA